MGVALICSFSVPGTEVINSSYEKKMTRFVSFEAESCGMPLGNRICGEECSICLERLGTLRISVLPCSHALHATCLEQLRNYGVSQSCSLCRAMLPPLAPLPRDLFDKAIDLYSIVEERVVAGQTHWDSMSRQEQRLMSKAINLWIEAAGQGLIEAMYNLGLMYRLGRGVLRDDKRAVSWYRDAASRGHANAQNNLGFMYNHNRGGVGLNDKEAVRWYSLAAQQGLTDAQFNLGVMYRQGRGVDQSDVEAVHWYTRASRGGSSEALNALKRIRCEYGDEQFTYLVESSGNTWQ